MTAAIGIETFIVSGLPHAAATASRRQRGEPHVRPAHAMRVGELEDAFGPGVEGAMNRMAESRRPASGRADRLRRLRGRVFGRRTGDHGRLHLVEPPRALARRAGDHGPAAEDPRRDRALKRARIGSQGHPGRDAGRHHPVLGDRDQQQIEEEALLRCGLVAGDQQVKVLGERQPAHDVAAEIAPAYLDPIGIRLGDPADGARRATDRHPRNTVSDSDGSLRQP